MTDVSPPRTSNPSSDASPAPVPTPGAGERPPGSTTVRVTALVALLGVLVAVGAVGWGGWPLRTPTQDCGTAATFLIGGRVNQFVDPSNPPDGITPAEARANNQEPCQERAGNRALPAGVVLVSGTLIALLALIVEFFVRLRLARRGRATTQAVN